MPSHDTKFVAYPKTVALKALKGDFLKRRAKFYSKRSEPTSASFTGTVKIDGTNTSIVFAADDPVINYHYQSRNQIITIEKDNHGAAKFLTDKLEIITTSLACFLQGGSQVMVTGELAGQSISRSGTAIEPLPKFFVIFAIIVDGVFLEQKVWEHIRFSGRVYNIFEFPTYRVKINFAEERDVGGGKEANDLAREIDLQCPVAFKLAGIECGLGEGIVWQEDKDISIPVEPMRFKSVGPSLNVNADPKEKAEMRVERAARVKHLEPALNMSEGSPMMKPLPHKAAPQIHNKNMTMDSQPSPAPQVKHAMSTIKIKACTIEEEISAIQLVDLDLAKTGPEPTSDTDVVRPVSLLESTAAHILNASRFSSQSLKAEHDRIPYSFAGTDLVPNTLFSVTPSRDIVEFKDNTFRKLVITAMNTNRLFSGIRYTMEAQWKGGENIESFLKTFENRTQVVDWLVEDIMTEEDYQIVGPSDERAKETYMTDFRRGLAVFGRQLLCDTCRGKNDDEMMAAMV